MKSDYLYNKLAKYFSGESSPSEIKEINQWLNENDKNKILFEEIKTVWESAGTSQKYFNTEKAWTAVKEKTINQQEVLEERSLYNYSKIIFNPVLLKTAASIIIFTLISIFVYNHFTNTNYSVSKNINVIASGKNEIRKVRLNDGTFVTLNSNSFLNVPEVFSKNERSVYLSGEAYFEVAHDKKSPFYVKTNNTTVKVLGTKFNVTAWDEDTDVTVAVAEGKVNFNSNLANPNNAVLVSRGEISQVIKSAPPVTPFKIDVEKYYFFWLNDELNFYNA